jgi:ribosomal protein S12 methylthiotransferase accessory factor YcaO
MTTFLSVEIELSETKLLEAFRRLRQPQRISLLNQLKGLDKLELPTVPAYRLDALTSLVSLGGDALLDSERIYND